MDPQALLVAFNKARVETEYDRDLEEKIGEGRLIYKSKGEASLNSLFFLAPAVGVF